MRVKDIEVGMRVITGFGLATVTCLVSRQSLGKNGFYVELIMDNQIPGRKNVDDRSWSTLPRNIKPAAIQ